MSNLQTGGLTVVVLFILLALYFVLDNMSRKSITEALGAIIEWAWEWTKVIVIVAVLGAILTAFLELLGMFVNWVLF